MAIVFVSNFQLIYVNEYKKQIKQNILHNIKLQQKCKMKNMHTMSKRYDNEINRLTMELDRLYQIEHRAKSFH